MTRSPSHSQAVLITGGAIRLGRHTALHLAAQGWNVAIHYHHSQSEAEATTAELLKCGIKATAIQGDLTQESCLKRLIPEAEDKLAQPITALVNNAAMFQKDSIETFTAESWLQHMQINSYAPLRLISEFASHLPESSNGAVVNLIDGCKGMCLSPAFLSYSLSKNALAEATKLLALSLAPRIRVNGISPGMTLPKAGEEAMFARLVSKLPLQQATHPQEIAEAIAYVLSATSMTGEIIALNGGAGLKNEI
ncbi:MAG: SDR family oxidoreductase [Alphaproteobacteria bacterium]|nr:SDR family oxidoreductase [Alphaproteobacteria bacterium]